MWWVSTTTSDQRAAQAAQRFSSHKPPSGGFFIGALATTARFLGLPRRVPSLRLRLASGPQTARALATALGVSQPAVSRALAALDAAFVGAAPAIWPAVTQRLAQARVITTAAAAGAQLLWAFGALIGNTDMHAGNLSFRSEHGRPYALAPAYDMTPMAFTPRSSGSLPDTLPEARLDPGVPHATCGGRRRPWRAPMCCGCRPRQASVNASPPAWRRWRGVWRWRQGRSSGWGEGGDEVKNAIMLRAYCDRFIPGRCYFNQ